MTNTVNAAHYMCTSSPSLISYLSYHKFYCYPSKVQASFFCPDDRSDIHVTLLSPSPFAFHLSPSYMELPSELLPPRSQDRAPQGSGRHGIISKQRLRTAVGKPYAYTCTRKIVPDTRADTQTSQAIRQHTQIRLPLRLWIPFLMLLISMSPNSCSGGA